MGRGLSGLWGVHLAVEPARYFFGGVFFFFPLPRRLSGAVVVVGAGGRVHVGRGRVHVVVVRVSPDAGQRVGRRPGLGAQVVFVGAGVLVGVVVQGVGGQRVGLGPQVVGRAGPPAAQRHGVEAPRDGQGGAEHAGHELVGGVGVDGRGPGVTLVLPPAVLCVAGRRDGGQRKRTHQVIQRTKRQYFKFIYFKIGCRPFNQHLDVKMQNNSKLWIFIFSSFAGWLNYTVDINKLSTSEIILKPTKHF